ncbi:unnamed protein product [Nesidiocoris tenuis]|uniref:PABS domain-containing protein n=1 Tax=Nesidiocoris tenuis TaxID=355587 RepID=A0A6H5HED6_9HEMI|nr:unnamed protein product [Nesidiocoris tenuis]
MKNLHCEDRPQMVFEEMDALQMTYDDQTFHVVFDKGTLDALMVDDKEETKERVEQYFSVMKTRRGHERTIIDTTSLCCTHHSYMCMGAIAAKKMSQILVIGLGGGSLCSYLRKALPKSVITAVELDPEMKDVAVKYFGLVEDKQLLIYIKDGLEFMKEISNEGNIVCLLSNRIFRGNHRI